MLKEGKIAEWMVLAEEVAREAGVQLREGARKSKQVNFEDAEDVKLQADVDSEKLIRDRFEVTGLGLIGEEGGGDEGLLDGDEWFWVVDPLDGTYNYLREQRETCVSIGLMRGNSFEGGVIYDFTSDEMVSGYVGGGVRMNGEELRMRWVEEIEEGCIMTGFPGLKVRDNMSKYFEKIAKFKKVRMIGSAALELMGVAVGRADAYYEGHIRLWDVAAGAALVRAAGGYLKYRRVGEMSYDFWALGKEKWAKELGV